jgi:hypothetical protein
MQRNVKPKKNRKGDTGKISGYDVCQTPPYAVEALFPTLDYYAAANFKHKNRLLIWESAAGPDELIASTLQNHGYSVISTDLVHDPLYNFFNFDPYKDTEEKWDRLTAQVNNWHIQITNPPWSIKYQWIKRSCELGKPFVLLLPYETTFAAKFQRIFEQYQNNPYPFVVLSPTKRINFKMPEKGWGKLEWDETQQEYVMRGNSAQMPSMWLTWGLTQSYSPWLVTKYIEISPVKYDENNRIKV